MRNILVVLFAWCILAGPVVPVGPSEAGPHEQSSGGHSAPRPPFRWWTSEAYRKELKLTSDQSTLIGNIVQASIARLRADKEDLDRAQGDFRQLMERPDASERDLLTAADRMEMARYAISRERTRMLVRIHSVLTPEQRKGLDAIAKRHERERRRSR